MNNIFYAQSGGVTPVINASALGVIKASGSYKNKIDKVLVGKNGILGALNEDLIDISNEPIEQINLLKFTPAGAFGSCRFKLKSYEEDLRKYERIIEVFSKHNIKYFLYNGGGDSADTCLKISKFSKSVGYPIQAIHIPKTIDNDLPYTDNSPGFGSVAKYIAISVKEASLDVASMCNSSTKVFILEVMGRHAGWIAAAGALASEKYKLPIVILFPEIKFNKNKFLSLVSKKIKQFGFCSIVISEGIKDNKGNFFSSSKKKDAFGHSQLGGVANYFSNMVANTLNIKTHWAVSDYLQRSARHISSKTDVDQAFQLGKSAVKYAISGHNEIMLTIKRLSNKPYKWEIGKISLIKVANIEKKLPMKFISPDGFNITNDCRKYLLPLIHGESYPNYLNGLPIYANLRNKTIRKKLKKFKFYN